MPKDADAQLKAGSLLLMAGRVEDAKVRADKALAASCYAEILERKPDDTNAIRFLGRVLSETERYPELAALMAREVQLSEAKGATEEALELMVRLGRLRLSRLQDPRGALTLYQEVLRRKPAHASAVGALEEMARSDNPLKGEAAATLEPVFAGEGEHLKLVQMLESRVESEANPAERVALLKKIAEVYSAQMDNAEMAFLAAARALRELPDDDGALQAAVGLFQKADAHDEMMALLGEVAPRASTEPARANLPRLRGRGVHEDRPLRLARGKEAQCAVIPLLRGEKIALMSVPAGSYGIVFDQSVHEAVQAYVAVHGVLPVGKGWHPAGAFRQGYTRKGYSATC